MGQPPEAGPEVLLRELYDRSWVRLVRLAALMLGSSDYAEEVVQNAFIAVSARAERFGSADAAARYLRTCVMNGCRSVHRHRGVIERHPLPSPVPAELPDEAAVRSDDRRQVITALHQLPPRQREVLVLRYYADATEAEIAETLSISRGSVKSHVHRGLIRLRRLIDSQGWNS